MIHIQLNDTYTLHARRNKLTVKITALSPTESTFTITGRGVENPAQPRIMSTLALAKWLIQNKATRTKRKNTSSNSPNS
ncbi:MAG: hypothetical protein H6636_06880 [Anaerolineales bacterium]|nr:hypothetical protein [Anaerolineales bacterium]